MGLYIDDLSDHKAYPEDSLRCTDKLVDSDSLKYFNRRYYICKEATNAS